MPYLSKFVLEMCMDGEGQMSEFYFGWPCLASLKYMSTAFFRQSDCSYKQSPDVHEPYSEAWSSAFPVLILS